MNASRFLYGFIISGLIVGGMTSAMAQETGSVAGTVRDTETREVIPHANVRLKNTPFGAATDMNGQFAIARIPPGTYTLVVSTVGYKTVELPLVVRAGQVTRSNTELKSLPIQVGEVLVYGASLRRERITDAPAAVSVINAKEIVRGGGHGQLPKLLESEPGIDIVQSGLFDFNVNTRGFNSSLNRRLLILLDGRDLATAFLSATEWSGLSIPLEELGRIELVRGPGSALYGANAYNGVLNISSLPPKASLGTRVIASGGELSAFRGDIRHADKAGSLSYRVNAGIMSSKSFSRVRTNRQFEYEGFNAYLNNEVVDLNLNPIRTVYGQARVDYEYDGGGTSTLEGGFAQVENEVIVTGIGRVQVQQATRPWVRAAYSGHGFNVLLWSNGRYNKKPEKSLSTGLHLVQDALITHGEIQYAFSALENTLFVVAGLSHRIIDIDTKGTLMQSPRTDNTSGVFAQTEYRFSETLKGIVASRWDRSSLHESFLSPKAALVWSPSAGHTLRATVNRAFQSPNYSELYLYVKHPTSPLAYFGNDALAVEKIIGYEIGYKGVIENALFITADVYFNQLSDFITDLGPGLNPKYSGTVVLPGENFSRTVWSYTNAGKVNEAGFEVAANYYLSNEWMVDANYALFTFEVVERHPNDVLLPNSPRHKANVGVTYTHPKGHDISVKVKYVPEFEWAAGVFRGTIKPYTLVNLSGSYSLTESITAVLNVSNLLNKQHYQIFGGSLLSRRAMATLIATF